MPTLADLAPTKELTDGIRARRKSLQRAQPEISLYANLPGVTGLVKRGDINFLDCRKTNFQGRNNVSSPLQITIPTWHYLAKWIVTIPNDPDYCKNVVLRVDMYGGELRETGLLHHWTVEDIDGVPYLTMFFNDDLQYLQFTLCPPNPALPIDIFQFPRDYWLFCPALWGSSATFFMNVARQELNLWLLPEDPFDLSSYLEPLDTTAWQVHVKCPNLATDSSLWSIFVSRMNSVDSVIADALDDAQLTITYRRIFTDEGETVTGLLNNNVANGALVFEIVDNSGFAAGDGSYFSGSIVGGFERSVIQWTSDFLDDTFGLITDDESLTPDEYWQSGWLRTLAKKTGIVVADSPWNDLQSKITYQTSTVSQIIVGGDNPTTDAIAQLIITSVGNLLGYFLLLGFDSAGDIAADVIMPFLVGTIAAWDQFINTARAREQGWAHLWEAVQSGADQNAWSLSALAVARGGMKDTAAQTAHTFVVDDGTWLIPGMHCNIGDRLGSTFAELERMGVELLFVNQLQEMDFESDENGKWKFVMKIGQNKASMSRGERDAQMFKKAMDTVADIGFHLVS